MKRLLCAAVLLLTMAATGSAQDIPLSKILIEGEGWKVAAKDLPGITFLQGDPSQKVFINVGLSRMELAPNGKVANSGMSTGAPDNIVKLGGSYYIDKANKSLVGWRLPGDRTGQTIKLADLVEPSCLALWPDNAQLVIGDAAGKYLWTARIEKDGTLGGVDRYYSLRVKKGEKGSGVTAMVMDAGNLLYAATPLGVQVFDPTGRLCGAILPPSKEKMTAITIGGKDANMLFVACGDKIYSRKIQGKAAYTLKKEK